MDSSDSTFFSNIEMPDQKSTVGHFVVIRIRNSLLMNEVHVRKEFAVLRDLARLIVVEGSWVLVAVLAGGFMAQDSVEWACESAAVVTIFALEGELE